MSFSCKKVVVVVAYSVAEKPTHSQTFHGVKITAHGYIKVTVDQLVDGWDDLELEIPGGYDKNNLGEAIHD